MKIDLSALKDALPAYLERYLPERITCKGRGSYQLRCPLHDDKHPSFNADNKRGTWLYHCFSCGSAGSVIDLHAAIHSQPSRSPEAIIATAEALGIQPADHTHSDKEKRQWKNQKREAEALAQQRLLAEAKQGLITAHLQRELCRLLKPYLVENWRVALLDASPLNFDAPEAAPRDFIRNLFLAESILWLGETTDTGQPHHKANFRTCKQWLQLDTLPPRISAGTYKAGSYSRSLDSVHTAPFIILESDDLIGHKPTTEADKERNKALSHALICYAQARLGLQLAAVIDTGNKSLHAWFQRPPARDLEALYQLAEGLSLDLGVIRRCQALPLRLPGTIHEAAGTPARLLYLNPQTL